jgi:hypothetical protein
LSAQTQPSVSGWPIGSGRITSTLTKLKMTVLAPIARASVRTTMAG